MHGTLAGKREDDIHPNISIQLGHLQVSVKVTDQMDFLNGLSYSI